MNSQLTWYNADKSIILWERFYPTTWEVAHRRQNKLFEMLNTVNHKVDIIVKLSDLHLPANAVPTLQRLLDHVHPNERFKVIVNATSMTRQMFNAAGGVNQRFDAAWYFVDSVEAAESLLWELNNSACGKG